MSNGGFDCVIGNPPYLKERGNQEIFSPVMQSNYKKYHQGKMDYW
jgi:adenine-specific DNA-methyltransferase